MVLKFGLLWTNISCELIINNFIDTLNVHFTAYIAGQLISFLFFFRLCLVSCCLLDRVVVKSAKNQNKSWKVWKSWKKMNGGQEAENDNWNAHDRPLVFLYMLFFWDIRSRGHHWIDYVGFLSFNVLLNDMIRCHSRHFSATNFLTIYCLLFALLTSQPHFSYYLLFVFCHQVADYISRQPLVDRSRA